MEFSKSRIFLYLCLSFILGIFIASLIKIPFALIGGFFVFGILLAAIFWTRDRRIIVIGFCIMIFALGILRYIQKEQVGNLSQLNNRGRLTIIGAIDDLPDRRQTSQKLTVKVTQATVSGKRLTVGGLALVTTKLYPDYNYGDEVEITGLLKEPENINDFDYKSYLAKSDIYSVMGFPEIKALEGIGHLDKKVPDALFKLKKGLFWLKRDFESVLSKSLPEPQASFMAGLTLGEKKTMPANLTEALKKTGTTHIVALSGYNIGLIAGFIMSLLTMLAVRRTLRFWLAVLAIIFFTVLTGASASIVRAAIMGILVLLARQEGRMYNIRNALVFAGAVMVYLSPKILRFDIGFQLSFLATMGLVWLAPVFDPHTLRGAGVEKWFAGLSKLYKLKEILIATLSAQLAVLPLLLVYFGQLSIISPMVNLLILLLVPQTMLLGFATGIVGMFWLLPAKLFAWIAWLYLTVELSVIKFFADLPLASVNLRWNWFLAIFYYAVILFLLYKFHKKQRSIILVNQWTEN